mmetsp:Transcript_68426/g.164282  ORF Transcript_68426/g.164282 Transcript_68426/m.164282 type:complete len:952 (-) Transcript_68426:144-2999(-)
MKIGSEMWRWSSLPLQLAVLTLAAGFLRNAAAVKVASSSSLNQVRLVANRTRISLVQLLREEPETLAEYCSGKGSEDDSESSKMTEKARVEADWRGFGTMYPGVVKKVNEHSLEILYDDGWEEEIKDKNMDGEYSKVNPLPSEETTEVKKEEKETKPVDDPVCDLVDEVDATKVKVKDIFKDIALWTATKRAQVSGKALAVVGARSGAGAGAPAPAPAQAAAPAPATASPTWQSPAPSPAILDQATTAQADELKRLAEELAAVDEQIRELKQAVADNDVIIQSNMPDDEASAKERARSSVDDLIEEYKKRLEERKKELAELEKKLAKQEQQLAVMGASQVSLDQIDKDIDELEALARKLKRKRDKFEEDGKLDPELRAYIDHLIEEAAKLREKVDALMEAEKAAQAAEEAAAKAELKASDEAQLEGGDVSGHKEATKASKLAREQEEKVFEAAQSVEEELETIDEDTEKLNSGLHPHGDRWWRYRYEHSFIEALLMIWVLIFMLFWETVAQKMRAKAYALSDAETASVAVSGTLYIHWVENVALELMAVLAVFVTVWLIAQFHMFDYIPLLLHPEDIPGEIPADMPDAKKLAEGVHLPEAPTGHSLLASGVRLLTGTSASDMHLPHTGDQYRRLAVDEVVILAIALLFYYSLTAAVVYQATEKLEKWTSFEEEALKAAGDVGTMSGTMSMAMSSSQRKSLKTAKSLSRMATVGPGQDEFFLLKSHFWDYCSTDPGMQKVIQQYELTSTKKVTEDTFPFWLYLRLNVRGTVDELYTFGWIVWLPIILTFCVLCLLHRFMHMGYIRIMLFFLAVQVTLCISMFLAIRAVNKEVAESKAELEEEAKTKIGAGAQSALAAAEHWMVWLIQYSGFFLGYGASRMICQEWMWKLHFWPVVGVCFVLFFLALAYVLLIAPMVPTFAAAMALPPFVDASNAEKVIDALQENRKRSTQSA